METSLGCLEDLGFTPPCATIWYYNSQSTQQHCLVECLAALESPFMDEEGTLNPCIQCDEDMSGPVFKSVAGRIRRNSGLATALCRPCETVSHIHHIYP